MPTREEGMVLLRRRAGWWTGHWQSQEGRWLHLGAPARLLEEHCVEEQRVKVKLRGELRDLGKPMNFPMSSILSFKIEKVIGPTSLGCGQYYCVNLCKGHGTGQTQSAL